MTSGVFWASEATSHSPSRQRGLQPERPDSTQNWREAPPFSRLPLLIVGTPYPKNSNNVFKKWFSAK